MAILLTNDDGAEAPGLAALAEALLGLDDLYISAPATNQSGVGTGISLGRDMAVTRLSDGPGGAPRYAIAGTPADAVKFGLQHAVPETPRLVASGVNLGLNIGRNLRCSGTVGAALEAIGSGLPALAVSIEFKPGSPTDWEGAKRYARLMAEKALRLAERRESPLLLNLNVPMRPAGGIRGLVATRHGVGGIRDILVPRDGGDAYFMEGEWVDAGAGSDCDAAAVREGYAVVTPIQCDLTDHGVLEELRRDWRETLAVR